MIVEVLTEQLSIFSETALLWFDMLPPLPSQHLPTSVINRLTSTSKMLTSNSARSRSVLWLGTANVKSTSSQNLWVAMLLTVRYLAAALPTPAYLQTETVRLRDYWTSPPQVLYSSRPRNRAHLHYWTPPLSVWNQVGMDQLVCIRRKSYQKLCTEHTIPSDRNFLSFQKIVLSLKLDQQNKSYGC